MKTVYGKMFNINSNILGRITFGERNIFKRSKDILVTNEITKNNYNYKAIITSNSQIIIKDKPLFITDNLDIFNEGDVVLINKDGEAVILYEIGTHSNSLLITERCNHCCVTCPQPPKKSENDKTLFNLELISLMDKNTSQIGITGGEPTLIGDSLFKIIKSINKKMPKAFINILSNGVKFSDIKYAINLIKYCCKNVQIDIPLFHDIASMHNKMVGANTFYKTVQGLYNLALLKQKIGIRIVVNKMNYRRLPHISEFIYHNFPFVSQVAFMSMEVIGHAKNNIDELWIDPYDYREELRIAVTNLNNFGITTFIYNTPLCILPKNIMKHAKQSISAWKNIYIDECEHCIVKKECAGFFASNKQYNSKYIKAIREVPINIELI